MRKVILISFVLAGLLFNCKKYEDGPLISLRSAKTRVTGIWTVNKFYINGVDSTDQYFLKLGCKIDFTAEIYYTSQDKWTVFLNNCNNGKTLRGQWSFDKTKKSLAKIYFPEDTVFKYAIGPLGQNKGADWTILRLTNSEFNLSTDYFGYDGLGTRNFILELKK